MVRKPVGFIGQGFIGKSYADDFERRGLETIRYSLERQYLPNKDKIKECDVVFIAVPTPTTHKGFDHSIVVSVLKLLSPGTTAVIKSTILPGTSDDLQKKFPKLFVIHSPEFLVLKQAAEDAARPLRNIIGISRNTPAYHVKAKKVLQMLPRAPFELICSASEAELIKYSGNFFLYLKVLFANTIFDAARVSKADYEVIRSAIAADPRIGPSHLQVLHGSGHKGARKGRGAGGVCFIKDVAALSDFYRHKTRDSAGADFIDAAIAKNICLLRRSKKDIDLLEGVYGKKV